MEQLDRVKLARLAWMFVALLDETRLATLDEQACARLASMVQRSLVELGSALPDELIQELGSLLPRDDRRTPGQTDLLLLEAQVVGWLRGMLRPQES